MFILRDSFNGKLISGLNDGRPYYARHIGGTIKFPTSDEAEFYASENGFDWNNYTVERAG